jgi:hypothetical protein
MPYVKGYTTCCHMCRTSLTHHKREYLACCSCNWIFCKNCFGTKIPHLHWEEETARRGHWQCPGCDGTCPCPRCVKLGPRVMKRQACQLEDQQDLFQNRSDLIPHSGHEHHSHLCEESLQKMRPHRNEYHRSHYKRRKLNESPLSSDEDEESNFSEEHETNGSDLPISDSSSSSSPGTIFRLTKHPSSNTHKSVVKEESVKHEKPNYRDAISMHFEELTQREKRCEATIREMERMLLLMKKEKQEIALERQKILLYLHEIES